LPAAPFGTTACLRFATASRLPPIELADAYFGLEQQLHNNLGLAVDLVMASALRNPTVRADIETSKRLI
jgi:predicted nucleotidyltransferase